MSVNSIQDERLIKFLMGLNDTYSPARSNILMITPLPSVSLAYSLIMQDEKQRKVAVNSHFSGNSVSFLATNHSSTPQNDLRSKKLVCSHCKKPGHSIDKCYRIIGFPVEFKFTRTTRV